MSSNSSSFKRFRHFLFPVVKIWAAQLTKLTFLFLFQEIIKPSNKTLPETGYWKGLD